jgi:cystathionine beta-lyase family protein involved in aluminum resistance
MTKDVIAQKYLEMGISKEVYEFGNKIEETLKERFDKIDETVEYNQMKVIHAMQKKTCQCRMFSGNEWLWLQRSGT